MVQWPVYAQMDAVRQTHLLHFLMGVTYVQCQCTEPWHIGPCMHKCVLWDKQICCIFSWVWRMFSVSVQSHGLVACICTSLCCWANMSVAFLHNCDTCSVPMCSVTVQRPMYARVCLLKQYCCMFLRAVSHIKSQYRTPWCSMHKSVLLRQMYLLHFLHDEVACVCTSLGCETNCWNFFMIRAVRNIYLLHFLCRNSGLCMHKSVLWDKCIWCMCFMAVTYVHGDTQTLKHSCRYIMNDTWRK